VDGLDGVSTIRTAGSSKRTKVVETEKMDVDDESPVVESELSSLNEVLEEADVVVEVLDARDPMAYHSEHLTRLMKAKRGQKLLLVLNKIGELVESFM
jgi:nuclear GTP-binding protein